MTFAKDSKLDFIHRTKDYEYKENWEFIAMKQSGGQQMENL
jgi:hypothetical protein